jgi:chromosome segregation ATPase
MITALVDTLAGKLAIEERLRTNQTEIRSIEATLRTLEQVATSARALAAELDLCAPYLSEQVVSNIRAQMNSVGGELEVSRQRFATNRKEWLLIQKAGENLKRVSDELSRHWQGYAQAKLAPYLDLLRLVTYLPEVAASADEINRLVAQIKEQAARPPRAQAQLDQFHQRLAELGRRLDAIARLPAEVRAFLGTVVGGTATLADLTPEVQAWIAEGGRATAFSISFA